MPTRRNNMLCYMLSFSILFEGFRMYKSVAYFLCVAMLALLVQSLLERQSAARAEGAAPAPSTRSQGGGSAATRASAARR